MPAPLTAYIASWRQDHSLVADNLWSLGSYLNNAGTALQLHNYAAAGANLINAKNSAHAASQAFKLGGDNMYDDMFAAMGWIDDNIGGGGGVDMDGILTAMITAEFTELQKFIGLVDAYRVAIWNAPFNAEFYGALARGFAQWP